MNVENNLPDSIEKLDLNKKIQVNGEYLELEEGLPNGLLYKYYTGLGATYSEFKSNRHSIIVFPYRILALEKAKKYRACYVGTKDNEKGTTPEEIISFIKEKQKDGSSIKFAVVAESLRKVIEAIKKAGQNPYDDYFLVLDEVEVLQFHSKFRNQLPLCMDYLLEFKKKCMVSATMLEFSRMEINELDKYYVELSYVKKPKMHVIRTKDEPHIVLANRLLEKIKTNNLERTKAFVGINSIDGIRQIISIFEKAGMTDIAVLCSDSSKKSFERKYTSKGIINGKFQAKVNIATSAYWSGIDIEEHYIPYAVCIDTKLHHFFSVENLIQFQGRCRKFMNNPIRLIIPNRVKLSNFKLDPISIKTRIKELEEFLKKIEEDFSSSNDKSFIKKDLARGGSGLYYEGLKKGIPLVNWLLADLELHKEKLVEKLRNNASGLIEELAERFEIISDSEDVDGIDIKPDEGDILLEKNYDIFLSHLTPFQSTSFLIRNILESKSKQIKTAAYWYLFGLNAFKNHKESKALVELISSNANNCSIYSSAMAEIVRFYLDNPNLYKEFLKHIIERRPQKGVGKNKLSQNDLVEVLQGNKKHFPSFFKNDQSQNIKSKKAKAILEYFFQISPENPNANKPKYKIDSVLDLRPFGGNNAFLQFVKEFRKLPVTNTKLVSYKFEIETLIRYNFDS